MFVSARQMSLLLVTLASAVGCEKAPPQQYQPTMDMRQMMNWVLDPAADVLWGSAGAIITKEGEQDLSPTTEEGWHYVRNTAALVAEVGNLLKMPGYARTTEPDGPADPAWLGFSQALTDVGGVARAAAEAQDADALFDAGAALYQVCLGCHQHYAIDVE